MVLGIVGVGLWLAWPRLAGDRAPIRVGLLHSLTGPLAISEASMVDAEQMAVEEINAAGGLLGRKIEVVKADGRSDPATFAREASRLIEQEKVDVIFGCWTSTCRKAVKPVVERADHLLVYPVAYEGLERSPNIVYTGAAPNQQVIPTVKWVFDHLHGKKFFLVGSDTIWPHSVFTVIKDQLKALGAEPVGEVYIPFGSADASEALAKVQESKPDIILSAIEGDSNVGFYKTFRQGANRSASGPPIVSFSITEDELRDLPARDMNNDYVVCNYFQSIDLPQNHEFVNRFKLKYGANRVTCDAIATAYSSVFLWSQAVVEGSSSEVVRARFSMLRQSRNAPEGVISVDATNQNTYRPFFVGKVRPDGQVDIVFNLPRPIRPTPFPFSRTEEEWTKVASEIARSLDPSGDRKNRAAGDR